MKTPSISSRHTGTPDTVFLMCLLPCVHAFKCVYLLTWIGALFFYVIINEDKKPPHRISLKVCESTKP